MKTLLLLILVVLSGRGETRGSGPTTIDIATTDAGITYTLHDYDMRIEKDRQTPDEIETWLRTHAEGRKDQFVIIYPDDRTSFKTVLEMLRRFKAAGVKRFLVGRREQRQGAEIIHSLSGSTDEIRADNFGSKPSRQ